MKEISENSHNLSLDTDALSLISITKLQVEWCSNIIRAYINYINKLKFSSLQISTVWVYFQDKSSVQPWVAQCEVVKRTCRRHLAELKMLTQTIFPQSVVFPVGNWYNLNGFSHSDCCWPPLLSACSPYRSVCYRYYSKAGGIISACLSPAWGSSCTKDL